MKFITGISCESGSPFNTWMFERVCSTVFSPGAVGVGVVGFCAKVRLITTVRPAATTNMSRVNLRRLFFSRDMRRPLINVLCLESIVRITASCSQIPPTSATPPRFSRWSFNFTTTAVDKIDHKTPPGFSRWSFNLTTTTSSRPLRTPPGFSRWSFNFLASHF